MRVGLLGGTFDPVHAGHLELARACRAAAGLDQVRFMTNRVPPHKPPAVASGCHRHAMVALATAGDDALVADPRELEREGPSWTIDTLEELAAGEPQGEWHLLVGSDSLRDFATWRRARDLARLARVVAVGRAGTDLDAAAASSGVPADRLVLVRCEPPPWRSRDLREALRAGGAPAGSIPEAVVEYIRKNRLYAPRPAGRDAAGSRP